MGIHGHSQPLALLLRLLLLTLQEGTCHIPGVPLEAGLGLSGDLDPGAAAALGRVQRELSLSGAVLLLMTVTEKSGIGKHTAKHGASSYDVLPRSWVTKDDMSI